MDIAMSSGIISNDGGDDQPPAPAPAPQNQHQMDECSLTDLSTFLAGTSSSSIRIGFDDDSLLMGAQQHNVPNQPPLKGVAAPVLQLDTSPASLVPPSQPPATLNIATSALRPAVSPQGSITSRASAPAASVFGTSCSATQLFACIENAHGLITHRLRRLEWYFDSHMVDKLVAAHQEFYVDCSIFISLVEELVVSPPQQQQQQQQQEGNRGLHTSNDTQQPLVRGAPRTGARRGHFHSVSFHATQSSSSLLLPPASPLSERGVPCPRFDSDDSDSPGGSRGRTGSRSSSSSANVSNQQPFTRQPFKNLFPDEVVSTRNDPHHIATTRIAELRAALSRTVSIVSVLSSIGGGNGNGNGNGNGVASVSIPSLLYNGVSEDVLITSDSDSAVNSPLSAPVGGSGRLSFPDPRKPFAVQIPTGSTVINDALTSPQPYDSELVDDFRAAVSTIYRCCNQIVSTTRALSYDAQQLHQQHQQQLNAAPLSAQDIPPVSASSDNGRRNFLLSSSSRPLSSPDFLNGGSSTTIPGNLTTAATTAASSSSAMTTAAGSVSTRSWQRVLPFMNKLTKKSSRGSLSSMLKFGYSTGDLQAIAGSDDNSIPQTSAETNDAMGSTYDEVINSINAKRGSVASTVSEMQRSQHIDAVFIADMLRLRRELGTAAEALDGLKLSNASSLGRSAHRKQSSISSISSSNSSRDSVVASVLEVLKDGCNVLEQAASDVATFAQHERNRIESLTKTNESLLTSNNRLQLQIESLQLKLNNLTGINNSKQPTTLSVSDNRSASSNTNGLPTAPQSSRSSSGLLGVSGRTGSLSTEQSSSQQSFSLSSQSSSSDGAISDHDIGDVGTTSEDFEDSEVDRNVGRTMPKQVDSMLLQGTTKPTVVGIDNDYKVETNSSNIATNLDSISAARNSTVSSNSTFNQMPGTFFISRRKALPKRALTENEAATLIQAHCRRYICQKQFQAIRVRRMVIQEILDTERSYYTGLLILKNEFMWPLKKFEYHVPFVGAARSSVPFRESMEIVFKYIEELSLVTEMILSELTERIATFHVEKPIADIFISASKSMKLYAFFVANYEDAIEAFEKCMSISQFEKKVDSITKTRGLRHHGVKDLLITPVQRPPRYILMLRELLKRTTPEHPDYEQIKRAIVLMERAVAMINEKQKRSQNMKRVKRSLNFCPIDIIVPHRFLRHEGKLIEILESKSVSPLSEDTGILRSVYLFSDIFLCADIVPVKGSKVAPMHNYKWHIPIVDILEIIYNDNQSRTDPSVDFSIKIVYNTMLPGLEGSLTRAPTKAVKTLYARSFTEHRKWAHAMSSARKSVERASSIPSFAAQLQNPLPPAPPQPPQVVAPAAEQGIISTLVPASTTLPSVPGSVNSHNSSLVTVAPKKQTLVRGAAKTLS